jgi:streptogramin lyase
MKQKHRCLAAVLTAVFCCKGPLFAAEPAAGVAVDGDGSVYFTDAAQGPWKAEAGGKISAQEGPPANYLTLDPEGRFAAARVPAGLPRFERSGKSPTLIFSGQVPAAIGRDGALYFPQAGADGRLQIVRLLPSGTHSVLATLPATTENGPLESLNGIAVGPDGAVYYTENKAIRKVEREGTIATIVTSVVVPDCTRPPGADERLGPQLRGIDVAPDGSIYVAAAGCGATLRVSGDNQVTPVLRAPAPWSPKGVKARADELYVVETAEPGTPRVRKLSGDGRVSLVAEVQRK